MLSHQVGSSVATLGSFSADRRSMCIGPKISEALTEVCNLRAGGCLNPIALIQIQYGLSSVLYNSMSKNPRAAAATGLADPVARLYVLNRFASASSVIVAPDSPIPRLPGMDAFATISPVEAAELPKDESDDDPADDCSLMVRFRVCQPCHMFTATSQVY